ncbi:MAG: DUF4058 family protein [Planctomycetes bacterium]|nr:DUF4058 family protein [Planctomycetota bacterium]
MESGPFPGMDPYLEAHWRDVHSRLIIYACDQLQSQLPSDLRARVEERVLVDSPLEGQRVVYPDVRVVETARPRGGAQVAGASVTSEPLVLDVADEPMTETLVEVVEVGSGHRIVTSLEILSAANKEAGAGQEAYLRKQREMVQGQVNLVEIDLLRAGRRVVMAAAHRLPATHQTPYLVSVWRADRRTKIEVYRAPLRERLPLSRVPLPPTDKDASLDLQALVGLCWRNGGYDDIDYRREPDPELAPEDRVWADGLLKGRGLR